MVTLSKLLAYLDKLLNSQSFSDYCPNGLQVAGRNRVKTLVTGVTASQALLSEAVKLQADAILVHHGYFWRGEDAKLIGIKHQRIKTLIQHDISLIAYHLPLDVHPVFGNNKQLAKLLAIEVEQVYDIERTPGLLWVGRLKQQLTGEAFAQKIKHSLKREPLHISNNNKLITRVAWCTGAAQDFIEQAASYGVDAYVTGEVSERTFHLAHELGIHFYAAGHHATERYGVRALGEHLAEQFGIHCRFVDIENPA